MRTMSSRRCLAISLALLGLGACDKTEAPSGDERSVATPPASSTDDSKADDDGGEAETPEPEPEPKEPPGPKPGEPGPIAYIPAEHSEGVLPDKPRSKLSGESDQNHAERFGWTEDGSAFVLCKEMSGSGCAHCTTAKVDGQVRIVNALYASGNADRDDKGCSKSQTAKAEKLWAEGSYLSPPQVWTRHDLQLEWSASSGAKGLPASVVVKLAHKQTGAAVVLDRALASDPGVAAPDLHPDVFLLNQESSHWALITHVAEGGAEDRTRVRVGEMKSTLYDLYNRAGLELLEAKDYAGAAAAFEEAASLDPEHWRAPYNLACTKALAGHEAEGALSKAIELGGDDIVTKVKLDPDFDGVRDKEWFGALMQP